MEREPANQWFGDESEAALVRATIGAGLISNRSRLVTAILVALLVVAIDFALVLWPSYSVGTQGRDVLALIAFGLNIWLVRGDLASIGLTQPRQGWWYWARAALLIGLAVALLILVGVGAWVWSGHELPVYAVEPHSINAAFLHMCLFAPVVEETIYRVVVCVAVSAWLGPWTAIALSGVLFGALHVAYGNPSPENLVGGFFLAWAYLKSESILVPLLLHAAGNFCALASQVGTWYWLHGAV